MKNRGGFTILEVIITLSVSSLLFVTVMLAFDGRQGRVEFTQGLRDIQAYINDVANDVQDGYFPPLVNLTCSTPPSGQPVISYSLVTNEQGVNTNCVFAGKALFFNGATNSQIITTYTIAGRRDATTLSDFNPVVVAATDAGVVYSSSDSYKLPAGITLVDNSRIQTATLFGLFFDISAVSASSAGVISTVVPLGLELSGNTLIDIQNSVKNVFNADPALNTKKDLATLCFKSGTSDQYGTISIMKGINGLTTSVLIGSSNGSGCAVRG